MTKSRSSKLPRLTLSPTRLARVTGGLLSEIGMPVKDWNDDDVTRTLFQGGCNRAG